VPDRREAELGLRGREKLMLRLAIAGEIIAGVDAIGTWVPILQGPAEHLFGDGAPAAGSVPPTP
jgi:hypothetical protein